MQFVGYIAWLVVQITFFMLHLLFSFSAKYVKLHTLYIKRGIMCINLKYVLSF